MNVPNYVNEKIVDENGFLSEPWKQFFNQLINELNQNISQEGLVVPSLSSANTSVTPPHAGGQIQKISATAQNGTLVYDKNTNELKVRLSDGSFHVIQTV